MSVIYILSGRVFGENIYEINCCSDISSRLASELTGFPNRNVLLYKLNVVDNKIIDCKNLLLKTFEKQKIQNGACFYKIGLVEAKSKINAVLQFLEKNDQELDVAHKKKTCF